MHRTRSAALVVPATSCIRAALYLGHRWDSSYKWAVLGSDSSNWTQRESERLPDEQAGVPGKQAHGHPRLWDSLVQGCGPESQVRPGTQTVGAVYDRAFLRKG